MSPQRLAWRTLLQGRPRSVLAVLIIAAALCGLDLLAGHNASTRARLEYQVIIGDRLEAKAAKERHEGRRLESSLRLLPAISTTGGGLQASFEF